jgi:hypothetical protein
VDTLGERLGAGRLDRGEAISQALNGAPFLSAPGLRASTGT